MLPIAGCPFGTPGNRRQNSGDINRPKKPITPARSPTFISPSQRVSTPVSPSEISNALAAEVNDALVISLQMATSPQKIERYSATTNATKKKAIQI